jgi:F0F1-type ATP synthase membrane subunit b/b'
MCTYIYIYGKCLGFARNRNHDRQRIIVVIVIVIIIVVIVIIIIIIKPLLKIFNECRSLTGVG